MVKKSTSAVGGLASAVHLSSLLDLAIHVRGATSVQVLNATLLSVMGRLRIMRACVLRRHSGAWMADPTLCKGVLPVVLPSLDVVGVTEIGQADEETYLLAQRGIVRLVPLSGSDNQESVLALGPMFDEGQYDESVISYLELVGVIAGAAVASVEMVESLRTTTKELEARNLLITSLFESARDFTVAVTRDELLRMMAYRLMGQLMVNSFAIFLAKPLDDEDVIVMSSEELSLESLQPGILMIKEPWLVQDLPPDHPMLPALEEARIAMVAPVTIHGTLHGVIATRPKLSGRPFSNDEMRFLEALGNTALAAIENARLQEEENEKQRIEGELRIAASIQRGLLPIELPAIRGVTVAAEMRPSTVVGGDYYDVITLDGNRTLVAIADVAGKGIPAAMLMANVQAAMNVLAKLDLPLPDIVSRVNALVFENTEPDVFVTLFLGILNTLENSFEFVNAGHNPPLLVSDNGSTWLTDGGVILGIMANPPEYAVGTIDLNTGDVLVLYTDGVTEARQGLEEFGVDRLRLTVEEHRSKSASEILRAIHEAMMEFTSSEMNADDTSAVVLTVL